MILEGQSANSTLLETKGKRATQEATLSAYHGVVVPKRNVLYRLLYLNRWSPVGGTVPGSDATLMEEVHD